MNEGARVVARPDGAHPAATAPDQAATGTTQPYPHPIRAWSMVIVLALFYVLSLMDRNILSLLIEPMKQDLRLTDVEVSLFYGAAFALFYAVGSLPLGWARAEYESRLATWEKWQHVAELAQG